MSNNFVQDPRINKGQPITPTGMTKVNGCIDAYEFASERHIGNTPEAMNVAKVFSREPVFQRIGRVPNRDPEVDMPVTEVFASFNGIERGSESQFRFVGLACNEAEHQNRNGPLGGHFAIYVDGGNTIVCRSQLPISPGSFIKWRIPTSPGVPGDENNCGRLLPEIVAHNPGETGVDSALVHLSRHRVMHGMTPHDSERDQAVIAAEMYNSLQSIGYLSVLAYLQATGSQLSDAQKVQIATVMGIIDVRTSTDAQTKKHAQAAQSLLPDMIFQMRYEKSKDKSVHDQSKRPFQLQPLLSGNNSSADQKKIARETADPFGRMLALFMKQTEEDLRTVIGFTNTGGFPGYNMDIVLRRV